MSDDELVLTKAELAAVLARMEQMLPAMGQQRPACLFTIEMIRACIAHCHPIGVPMSWGLIAQAGVST